MPCLLLFRHLVEAGETDNPLQKHPQKEQNVFFACIRAKVVVLAS